MKNPVEFKKIWEPGYLSQPLTRVYARFIRIIKDVIYNNLGLAGKDILIKDTWADVLHPGDSDFREAGRH